MSWLEDTFTDADGTAISAHTGELGAVWSGITGLGGSPEPAIFSNALYGRDLSYWLASGVAPADGESASITISKKDTTATAVGVLIRGNSISGSCYQGWWHQDGRLRIYRLVGASTYTLLATGTDVPMSVGAHTLRIKATGVGTDVGDGVLLEVFVDGAGSANVSFNDTDATRLNVPGQAGAYFGAATTTTTGIHITEIADGDAAAPGAFAFTTPADGRIHQRSGTTGTITATGTYTGSPATIEARLVLDGTNTVVGGFDWATKVATPSGSAFSFNFAAVPQGGWYNIQIRDSAIPGSVIVSDKVAVGALFASTGQSNAFNMLRIGAGTLTADPLFRVYGQIGNWQTPDPSLSDGAIALGNALVAAFGCPVGYLDLAKDGAGLHGDWVPLTNSGYQLFKNTILALDGKIEGVFWAQAETDAAGGVTQIDYYTDLGTLFDAMRTDLGQPTLKIVLSTLHSVPLGGYGSDSTFQPIRKAQIQKCADTGIIRTERLDLAVGGDNIHHTPAAYVKQGLRLANAFKYIAGLASYYRGPRITSVTAVSASMYDVTITHGGGTDFTPTTGITGFRALDDTTPAAIASVARQSAGVARVTLASPAAGTVTIQYGYGKNPDISGVLVDNSALALPLEFTDGVVAAAPPPTGVVFLRSPRNSRRFLRLP